MLFYLKHKTPIIGRSSRVHPSADVVGDVEVGSGCWIGPHACVRGERGRILIGHNARLGNGCVINAALGGQTIIGNSVTIGDGATIHSGAILKDGAVIGKGCIVYTSAVVGEGALIGDGATVAQGQKIPKGGIAMGSPARVLEKRLDCARRFVRDSRFPQSGRNGPACTSTPHGASTVLMRI